MRALLIFLASAWAMTREQAAVARQVMKQLDAPPWSAIIDAALHNEISFTDQAASKTFIDAKKLIDTPHTYFNVLVHEVNHLKGSQHNDGTLAMSYKVTVDLVGAVIDDSYYLIMPSVLPAPRPTLAPSRPIGSLSDNRYR